jgi:hypothetical protein
MQPSKRVIAVGAVLLASALLIPGAVANADPADGNAQADAQGERTLQFDVQFSPFAYTDLGQSGPSAADIIVFHDILLQHGHEVGDEVGSCVVVDPSGLSNCTAVIRLSEQDTLAFSLVNAPPPRKILAITGGSGSYRTAQGDGVLVEHGDAANTGTLTLHVITN